MLNLAISRRAEKILYLLSILLNSSSSFSLLLGDVLLRGLDNLGIKSRQIKMAEFAYKSKIIDQLFFNLRFADSRTIAFKIRFFARRDG
jgi:hypothetical protein